MLLINLKQLFLGWHTRLNSRARRGKLDLYQLAPLLFNEAEYVTLQVNLISEKRLRRYQRTTYARLQRKLSDVWEKYAEHEITTSKLLRACAHIYGPGGK